MFFSKTDETFFSISYGCSKSIDCYRFLQRKLRHLGNTLDYKDSKISQKSYMYPSRNKTLLTKKLSCTYGNFTTPDEFEDPDITKILLKESFKSKQNPNSIMKRSKRQSDLKNLKNRTSNELTM